MSAPFIVRENYQNMAETGKKLVTNKFLHQCVLIGVLVGEKKTVHAYLPRRLLQSHAHALIWAYIRKHNISASVGHRESSFHSECLSDQALQLSHL